MKCLTDTDRSRNRTFLMHILSFVDMHHIWSNLDLIYVIKTVYCNRIQAYFVMLSLNFQPQNKAIANPAQTLGHGQSFCLGALGGKKD